MAWDPVPWFIGGDSEGGAEHSADIARMVAHYLMGGLEGVLGRFDLRVLPLSTPGAGYRVMPGAVAVNSAWQPRQSYLDYMPDYSEEEAGPQTPSTGGRTDLIVANILDPFAPGSPWDPPANRTHGPYIETTPIIDVPPGTASFAELGITNWSAKELARFDLPPSTQTITGDLITDLRSVVNPITGMEGPTGASKVQTYVRDSGAQTTDTLTYPANEVYTDWPAVASVPVHIPEWATRVTYDVRVTNVRVGSVLSFLGAFGDVRLVLGSNIVTEPHSFDFDGADTTHSNETMFCVGDIPIPPEYRDTTVNVKTQARLYDAYHPQAQLLAGQNRTKTIFEFNFRQTPSYT